MPKRVTIPVLIALLLAGIGYFRMSATSPSQQAAALCIEGDEALLRADDEGALAAYRKARDKDPDNPQSHLGIARVQIRRRQFVQAARTLRSVVSLAGDDAETWIALARVFRDARAFEQGISVYSKAIELAPERTELLIELGNLYSSWEHKGLHEVEAEKCYRQAEALWPDDPRIHAGLGRLFSLQSAYDSAAVRLRQALRHKPEDPELLTDFAEVAILRGTPQKAPPYLRQALTADPYHPRARYFLGRTYLMVGQKAEADREFAIFKRQKKVWDQIQSLEKSAAERPTAEAYQMLSHLYARMDRDSLAAERLRRATALDPMVTIPQEVDQTGAF